MFETPAFKKFFRYGILLAFVISGVCLLASCGVSGKKLPVLPSEVKGYLIIDGYAISGSSNRFWEYDIKDRKILEFTNNSVLEALNIFYESNSKSIQYRRDLKAAKQLKTIKSVLASPFVPEEFASDRVRDFLDGLARDHQKPLKPSERSAQKTFQEQIDSPSGEFKINIDNKAHSIGIKNTLSKEEKVLVFDNELCCEAVSPDSGYLAFFEYQPFSFNDGKTYVLRFVNLRTGEVFSVQHDQVAMPEGMLWLDEKGLNEIDPDSAGLQ